MISSDRRGFITKILSLAGVSALPSSVVKMEHLTPTKVVEFVTQFPSPMTLVEYKDLKTSFENKDRVTTLISVFKKSGKIMSETFSFHNSYSCWRVEFRSQADYDEWMSLTEELESHSDSKREMAGFKLSIRDIT